MEKLRELLGHRYANFDNRKSEWEYDFYDLLSLLCCRCLGCLYCDDSCPSQLHFLAEDLQLAGVEGKMDGKLCSSGEGVIDGKDLPVCTSSNV